MAKKLCRIVIVFIMAICVFCCKSKHNYNTYSLDQIGSQLWECNIENENDCIYMSLGTTNYKDSLLFISDFHKRKVVKIEIDNKKVASITKNGNGPGEIASPSSLVVKGKNLYIRDAGSGRVQKYDFNGKYLEQIHMKNMAGDYMVCDENNTLYFLNRGAGNKNYIISSNGESFWPIQECFKTMGGGYRAGNILLVNDKLYFINPYEIKIYTVNRKTKKEGEIYVNNIPNVFSWEKYYNQNISDEKTSKTIENDFVNQPMNLLKLNINNELYFILTVYNKTKDDVTYYVINMNGDCVFAFKDNNRSLVGIYNDILIFAERNEQMDCVYKYIGYKINKKLFNKNE